MSTLKGWKFPVEVDNATGRILTTEDNESIKQGIEIILSTQKGERKMRPNFGTDVNRFMFGNINLAFINQMAREVSQSISMWENNIEQLSVNASQDPQYTSRVNVEVEYITKISPAKERLEKTLDENDYI